jgi:hypothetical protein
LPSQPTLLGQEASSSVELLKIKGHGPGSRALLIFCGISRQIAGLAANNKPLPTGDGPAQRERLISDPGLCYLGLTTPVFLLNGLHLVFQAQFELLDANFLQLFIFREVSFFNQGVKTLGILIVFLGQPTKFFVAGKKLFTNGIYHPEEPPAVLFTER